MHPNSLAKDFLKISNQFKLGTLNTESFHPDTKNLSELVQSNLKKSINCLKDVDSKALSTLLKYEGEFQSLVVAIRKCLNQKGRIVLVGCGATGRLSLALERHWRINLFSHCPEQDQILSFIAGGDVALIHSIEDFEDSLFYSVKTLEEHNIGHLDLVIGITEGGETPYVLKAVDYATEKCLLNPYLLFCNPIEQLIHLTERTQQTLSDPKVKCISLDCGPQAISGSTRMQASSVLMLFVAMAMEKIKSNDFSYEATLYKLILSWKNLNLDFLQEYITQEAQIYLNGGIVNYITQISLAIHLLTDTTERAPTFSLRGFENFNDIPRKESLSYLFVEGTRNAKQAWQELLGRAPRCLQWPEIAHRTGAQRLYGFDISQTAICEREHAKGVFRIMQNEDEICFSFNHHDHRLLLPHQIFMRDLFLKMIMNIHSTLVMGKLGRYKGNCMTYVKASNNKLIDRATRYILQLLAADNIHPTYEEVVNALFEVREEIHSDDPIVLEVYHHFKRSLKQEA